jgi:hypothetical protein
MFLSSVNAGAGGHKATRLVSDYYAKRIDVLTQGRLVTDGFKDLLTALAEPGLDQIAFIIIFSHPDRVPVNGDLIPGAKRLDAIRRTIKLGVWQNGIGNRNIIIIYIATRIETGLISSHPAGILVIASLNPKHGPVQVASNYLHPDSFRKSVFVKIDLPGTIIAGRVYQNSDPRRCGRGSDGWSAAGSTGQGRSQGDRGGKGRGNRDRNGHFNDPGDFQGHIPSHYDRLKDWHKRRCYRRWFTGNPSENKQHGNTGYPEEFQGMDEFSNIAASLYHFFTKLKTFLYQKTQEYRGFTAFAVSCGSVGCIILDNFNMPLPYFAACLSYRLMINLF